MCILYNTWEESSIMTLPSTEYVVTVFVNLLFNQVIQKLISDVGNSINWQNLLNCSVYYQRVFLRDGCPRLWVELFWRRVSNSEHKVQNVISGGGKSYKALFTNLKHFLAFAGCSCNKLVVRPPSIPG